MLPNQAARSIFCIARRSMICLVSSLLLLTPARGDDKSKDEETLRNASTVLNAMLESGNIPHDLLAKADCVVVLPGVKKFGLGVGGIGGRGPMSCRRGNNFGGDWSAPAMYSVGGASIGLQAGGSSTDYVLLITPGGQGLVSLLNSKIPKHSA